MNEHYRNINILNGLNLEAPIYKFFPLKYISTLLQGNLYVGKVAAWEDVYENFLFKQNFSLVDGTPVKADNLIKCNFGQSWTLSDETDAMWRIYSDIHHGSESDPLGNIAIRIKTTARKLFNAVYIDDKCMASTYIGAVTYLSQIELNDWLSKLYLETSSNLARTMAKSLFMKRIEFLHEHEVRIIISYAQDDSRVKEKGITFAINPANFIDEYLIDPRLVNTVREKEVQKRLIGLGSDETKIQTSQLYHFNPYHKPLVIH